MSQTSSSVDTRAGASKTRGQDSTASDSNPGLVIAMVIGWVLALLFLLSALYLWQNPLQPAAEELTAEEQYQQFMDADHDDMLELSLTASGRLEQQGAEASLVWSNTANEGYLRLRNVRANEPANSQFQIWIHDLYYKPGQQPPYPIPAGVFNSPGTQDFIVRIDPFRNISRAAAFEVSIEHPGGTVVSERRTIVLTATVE